MFGLISRKRHEAEVKAAVDKAIGKELKQNWNLQQFNNLEERINKLEADVERLEDWRCQFSVDVEQLKEAAAGKGRKREGRCPMMIRPLRF